MPHIQSPSDYVSSESQCDMYLTSDTEPSPSDAPLFPAWHRARRLNSLSEVALCQKALSAARLQCLLATNSCGTAQYFGIKPLLPGAAVAPTTPETRGTRAPPPTTPPQPKADSDTWLSVSDSSDAPVYRCNAYQCEDTLTDLEAFGKHKKLHEDTSDEEPVARTHILDSSSDGATFAYDGERVTQNAKCLRTISMVLGAATRVNQLKSALILYTQKKMATSPRVMRLQSAVKMNAYDKLPPCASPTA